MKTSEARRVSCEAHKGKRPQPRLVWNATFVAEDDPFHGWQLYRIEYGNECSCPEGSIWLPPGVRAEDVEELLND